MDAIVGDAMAAAEKQHAALIVLSDHGFASFRKSVNYNTWLVMNGYMTLKTGVQVKDRNVEMLFDSGPVLGERRLVAHARLRHGPRRDVHQRERPRVAGHRESRPRIRRAEIRS